MTTKTFAQQARKILLDGVAKKLLYWGFSPKGEVIESPESVSGGYTFRGDAFDDTNVPKLWRSLKTAVTKKGVEVVMEEAAYTWFNRMMAIRILAKNGYDLPQLEYAEGLNNTPIIIQKARQGQYDFLNATEKTRLQSIVGDYNKEKETFALLLVGYCHSHNTLNKVFGKLDDYTELLLPDNMLQDSGFLHLLNTTDAIIDDEYQEVELIGWLYQFYISERKDEVFASFKKKKKAEAKDIPAATQIFTPNWIVKYMVENTAGKIWLDKHPNSPLKNEMKYLVESSDDSSEISNSSALISNVEELTLLDPAVGSGHILVEGFDLLYQMYMEEYYTPEEAVESILKNNLYGLDLDDRAAQLANFAILLKAATQYRDVFTKGWLPNVYAMPESRDFSTQELKDFLGEEGKGYLEELDDALRLMKQAKNLGSVMKLSLSAEACTYIQERFQSLEKDDYLDINLESILQGLKAYIPILLILTKKFATVVANPPYLGPRNMNGQLKQYVDTNYSLTKTDLFATFIEVSIGLLANRGLTGLINQESWLFNSSYKSIRKKVIENYSVDSLLHLGTRTFNEVSGEKVRSVAFILSLETNPIGGTYYGLTSFNSSEKKRKAFLERKNEYKNVDQNNFLRIAGSPFAYWISTKVLSLFDQYKSLADYSSPRKGNSTSDNDRFLRLWHEVNKGKIAINYDNLSDATISGKNWIPYNKGGGTKKWYGYNEYLIDWTDNGNPIREIKTAVVTNEKFYMKPGLTWSAISSKAFGLRYFDEGFIFDNNGCCLFELGDKKDYLAALLNSKVFFYIIGQLNPALAFHPGDVKKFPVIFHSDINIPSLKNLDIAKKDWDSRETSWDFEQSPLLNAAINLEEAYTYWQKDITQDFFQLHTNEEEVNRIFIEIYGLQDELAPEVSLKDITILQEEIKSKDLEKLEPEFRERGANGIEIPIDKAEVISQFISYAIGVFMGRYRLDNLGMQIAHPNPSAEEIASYTYNGKTVNIDEDAILPLMGTECNFSDDVLQRFNELLDIIWGPDQRTENLNFIQECLDKDLEKFLVKDFYKYHHSKKMYDKKPIYWLFASPKGAFQVLVYMHRMNTFTVEKIRANYLLPHLKHLNTEIDALEMNKANLSTQEARKLDQLCKELRECEEYDLVLKNTADQQITFDLDDGVKENYKLFEDVVAKIK